MRKILAAFASLAILGALPVAVKAEKPPQGVYLRSFGGATGLTGFAADDACVSDASCEEFVANATPGFVVGGALGYLSGPIGPGRVRGELEGAYRRNDDDELSFELGTFSFDCDPGIDPCELLADTTAMTLMANLWYDVPFGNPWSFFVGGGVGGAWASLDDVGWTNPDMGPVSLVEMPDKELLLAYQVGVGIKVELPIGAELTAEYRYFSTDSPNFEALDALESFLGLENTHSNYTAHSAMVTFVLPLR